jgi:hypothetical protein
MLTNLRYLLWLYLILLFFEGALRKWILPALDTPLLLIRDPLVIWIYFQALRQGLSFNNSFFVPNLILAILTGATSLMFGQGGSHNTFITIFGLRTDFLQISLIFLIPQILHRDDVLAMGKFCLYVSLVMVVVCIIQFRSPPDSWWNKGGMATHYNSVRTSGTFSFGNGLGAFFGLTSAFLLYAYIQTGVYKIWLLGASTLSILLAAASCGSRGSIMDIVIVVVFAVLCVITRGKGGMGLLIGGAVIAVAVIIASTTSVAQQGADQMMDRFSDAGQAEGGAGGFVMRYVNSIVAPFSEAGDIPFFGYGLGLGTNAGLGLYDGTAELMWPEAEWDRLFFECGPLFGLCLCLFRLALTVAVARRAFAAYRRDNILPALLFGACAVLLFNGQWGVPTPLGFAIFVSGLTLAACEEPPDWEDEDDEFEPEHDETHDEADGESDQPHPADRIG